MCVIQMHIYNITTPRHGDVASTVQLMKDYRSKCPACTCMFFEVLNDLRLRQEYIRGSEREYHTPYCRVQTPFAKYIGQSTQSTHQLTTNVWHVTVRLYVHLVVVCVHIARNDKR